MNVAAPAALKGIVARSRAMRELLPLVARLAEARSPVLVEGESGTGKDLVAHWLHYGGPRREGPFIKVHCPSIPAELLESISRPLISSEKFVKMWNRHYGGSNN